MFYWSVIPQNLFVRILSLCMLPKYVLRNILYRYSVIAKRVWKSIREHQCSFLFGACNCMKQKNALFADLFVPGLASCEIEDAEFINYILFVSVILSYIPIRWFSTRTDSAKKSARHGPRDISYHLVRVLVCARECVLVWQWSRQQLWPLFGTIKLLCLRTTNHFNMIFNQWCGMLRTVYCWILNQDNLLKCIHYFGKVKNKSSIHSIRSNVTER